MPQAFKREVFKRGHAADWTLERVSKLSSQDIKRLRENAERLNEPEVMSLCDRALKECSRSRKSP
jgi:hypothetical protein